MGAIEQKPLIQESKVDSDTIVSKLQNVCTELDMLKKKMSELQIDEEVGIIKPIALDMAMKQQISDLIQQTISKSTTDTKLNSNPLKEEIAFEMLKSKDPIVVNASSPKKSKSPIKSMTKSSTNLELSDHVKEYIRQEIQSAIHHYEETRLKDILLNLTREFEERFKSKHVRWESDIEFEKNPSGKSTPDIFQREISRKSTPDILPKDISRKSTPDSSLQKDQDAEELLQLLLQKLNQKQQLVRKLERKKGTIMKNNMVYQKPTLSSQLKKRAFYL